MFFNTKPIFCEKEIHVYFLRKCAYVTVAGPHQQLASIIWLLTGILQEYGIGILQPAKQIVYNFLYIWESDHSLQCRVGFLELDCHCMQIQQILRLPCKKKPQHFLTHFWLKHTWDIPHSQVCKVSTLLDNTNKEITKM